MNNPQPTLCFGREGERERRKRNERLGPRRERERERERESVELFQTEIPAIMH